MGYSSIRPGIGQNIASHALLAAIHSVFGTFAFPIHSNSYSPRIYSKICNVCHEQ